MTTDLESTPVVGRAYRLGVNPITTTLVLAGPLLLLLLAVAGRNPATVALGIGYVLSIPASIAYFRITRDANSGGDDRDGG